MRLKYLPADKGTHYAGGSVIGMACAVATIFFQAFSSYWVADYVPALAALGGAAAAGFFWDYVVDVYVLKGPSDIRDALATTYGGAIVAAPLAALAGLGLLHFTR